MKIGYALAAPLLFVSSAAWAQQVQVQVGGPPPPPPPPQVVVTTPPPPPPPQGPMVGPPPIMVERPPFPRFRWGLSFEGGPFFFGGSTGGIGAVTVRAGAQINRLFGVYAQVGAFGGGGGAISSTDTSVEVIAAASLGVLAELDLGDVFYIAAGPELMAGEAGADSAGSGGASVSESAGAFFSITGRLGVVLGKIRPERRKGFQLGIDFHTIITPGGVVLTPMLSLGAEAF